MLFFHASSFSKWLTCTFSFLHFLGQLLNPTPEIVIPTAVVTNEAKVEMVKHPVTVKINISKYSI